jgi:hypothetical protein
MTRFATIALAAGMTATASAQNPCEGVGNAYLTVTPAIVGGTGVLSMGSPTAANSLGLLLWGDSGGPTLPFCLGTQGLFLSLATLLDNAGHATFTLNVGPTVFPVALYAKALVLEPSLTWSLSKTVLVSTEFANGWREIDALAQARSLHTQTAFHMSAFDDVTGALVAGGATGNLISPTALATTEIYDALNRTWVAGPSMSEPRTSHAALQLGDGTILITGGMTNAAIGTGGPATASCELYGRAARRGNGFWSGARAAGHQPDHSARANAGDYWRKRMRQNGAA